MNCSKILVAVLAASTLLLSACVVAPAGRPYYAEPVRIAPPPPRVEYPGYAPAPGYVWISGFWNWGGGRHDWVPGHWDAPRPGHAWVPHRWEREGEHWRQTGGHWEPHEEHRDHGRDHEHDHRDDRR